MGLYTNEIMKGRIASQNDSTWVTYPVSPKRKKGYHSCCLSKAPWRHKKNCFNVLEDEE